MGFVSFISSATSRIVRIVAGLALIGGGLAVDLTTSNTTLGIILAVVGFVPLGAGIFDICVFAPVFGAPLSGAKVRAHHYNTVH